MQSHACRLCTSYRKDKLNFGWLDIWYGKGAQARDGEGYTGPESILFDFSFTTRQIDALGSASIAQLLLV